jgi:hypothetical protein
MKIEETPRETSLYRKLAKDYTPKAADMKICKYIEALEERIATLEAGHNAQEEKIAAQENALAGLAEKITALEVAAQTQAKPGTKNKGEG